MPDIIPSIRLNAIDFKPMAFQPIQYQAAQPDQQIMPRSLQVQEARTEKANANIDAVDTAIAQVRNLLDTSEHDWLDQRANAIRERLDEQASLGNTQTAIRFAIEEARNLKRDAELADKVTVNQKRQKYIQELKTNNQISAETRRRAEAINKYRFDGTADWNPVWEPVREHTPQEIITLAGQLTAPDSGSTNTNTTTDVLLDAQGNQVSKPSEGIMLQSKTVTGRGRAFDKKTKEDMTQTMNDLLLQPEYYNGLKQYYESQLWAYYNAKSEANNELLDEETRVIHAGRAQAYAAQLESSDGIIPAYSDATGVDEEEFTKWIQKHITPMYRNMEYYNIRTQDTDANDYDPNYIARNRALQQTETYHPTGETVETTGAKSVVAYDRTDGSTQAWYTPIDKIYDTTAVDDLFD